jgi:hypothetical protein
MRCTFLPSTDKIAKSSSAIEVESCALRSLWLCCRLIAAGGGEVVDSISSSLQDLTHILAESKLLPQIQVWGLGWAGPGQA